MRAFRFGVAGVLLLVLSLFSASAAVMAQQATPTPSPTQSSQTPTPTVAAAGAQSPEAATATTVAQSAPNYPVAIHAGTCEMPTTEPAYDLGNAAPLGENSDNAQVMGTSATTPVLKASGTPDAGLDDLTSSPYVIAVHASPQDYATIVACGTIGGTVADNQMVIALLPVGGSQVTGIATLSNDDQSNVTVYLTTLAQGGQLATSSTTPTPVPTQSPAPTPTQAATQAPTQAPTQTPPPTPTPSPAPTQTTAPTPTPSS